MTTQQNDLHEDLWGLLARYEPLRDLRDLFWSVESLQKKFEWLGYGLDGPALNEMRNATYHLLNALLAEDGNKRSEQFDRATRHAQRAVYDCHEAILLTTLDELRKFKEDYATVLVTDVIPDWITLESKAHEAKSFIEDIRNKTSHDENREKYYSSIQPYVEELRGIGRRCDAARPELNKILRNNRRTRAMSILTFAISVAVLVVAIVSLLKN